MRAVFAVAFALSTIAASFAKEIIIITVGGNTTNNATTVFEPNSVKAQMGDVVVFNFTQGTHTATQSTFAGPCIPIHDSDPTINGFDSGFRDTNNGTAVTNLSVLVMDNTTTIWFFDWNTCAEAGVGGINVNGSSWQTLDGFQRNAMRLNGTATVSSHVATRTGGGASRTGEAGASVSPGSKASGAAEHGRAVVLGLSAVVPMVAAALLL